MTAPFDPSEYTRAPKVTFASAITLARALVHACPKAMPAPVKKACQRLLQSCERAETAWTTRHREDHTLSDEDTRLLDGAADRAWIALRDRASAYAFLPADRFPKAARAAELLQTLFGDGSMAFLRGTYAEQLAATGGILRRIDEDNLGKDLDAVCGPEFLANVRAVQPQYEAMVLALLGRDDASSDNLRELLRAIQRSIVSYAVAVCGTVDEDEPASAEVARTALLPMANLRASTARRGGGADGSAPAQGADAVEPQAPVMPAGAAAPVGGKPAKS